MRTNLAIKTTLPVLLGLLFSLSQLAGSSPIRAQVEPTATPFSPIVVQSNPNLGNVQPITLNEAANRVGVGDWLAAGYTGAGSMTYAATQGVWVIGADLDAYFITFEGGETPGSEYVLTSALRNIDIFVYDMLRALVEGSPTWPGGGSYTLSAANGGISIAPPHEATIPQNVTDRVNVILQMLAAGELSTGVDPLTGEVIGR